MENAKAYDQLKRGENAQQAQLGAGLAKASAPNQTTAGYRVAQNYAQQVKLPKPTAASSAPTMIRPRPKPIGPVRRASLPHPMRRRPGRAAALERCTTRRYAPPAIAASSIIFTNRVA